MNSGYVAILILIDAYSCHIVRMLKPDFISRIEPMVTLDRIFHEIFLLDEKLFREGDLVCS